MRKILVIDDEPASIAVFELLLGNLGYGVAGISDPTSAVEAIRMHNPELIFIDWSMPQMDGLQVIRQIRARKEFDDIPFVVSTGRRTESIDLKIALDAGASDFIRKPIDAIELQARVAAMFRFIDNVKRNIDLAIQLQLHEVENAEIKTLLLKSELAKKQREVALMSVNVHQNKKFLAMFKSDLFASDMLFDSRQKAYLSRLLVKYSSMNNSLNWDFLEKGFVQLHADFYTDLNNDFPALTWGELRLCAFFRIGMTIREVSVANFSNYETVKKAVQRIRRKLGLIERDDLNVFLQQY